jgi:hypothetical protein
LLPNLKNSQNHLENHTLKWAFVIIIKTKGKTEQIMTNDLVPKNEEKNETSGFIKSITEPLSQRG